MTTATTIKATQTTPVITRQILTPFFILFSNSKTKYIWVIQEVINTVLASGETKKIVFFPLFLWTLTSCHTFQWSFLFERQKHNYQIDWHMLNQPRALGGHGEERNRGRVKYFMGLSAHFFCFLKNSKTELKSLPPNPCVLNKLYTCKACPPRGRGALILFANNRINGSNRAKTNLLQSPDPNLLPWGLHQNLLYIPSTMALGKSE